MDIYASHKFFLPHAQVNNIVYHKRGGKNRQSKWLAFESHLWLKNWNMSFNTHFTSHATMVDRILTKEFWVGSIIHRLDKQISERIHLFFLNGWSSSLCVSALGFQRSRRSTSHRSSTVGGTATAAAIRRIGRRRVVRRTSHTRHAASGTMLMMSSRLNRLVQRLVVWSLYRQSPIVKWIQNKKNISTLQFEITLSTQLIPSVKTRRFNGTGVSM